MIPYSLAEFVRVAVSVRTQPGANALIASDMLKRAAEVIAHCQNAPEPCDYFDDEQTAYDAGRSYERELIIRMLMEAA